MKNRTLSNIANFKSCLLAFIVGLAALSSCKKDSENENNYFFTCKIDGVSTEFNSSTFAQVQNPAVGASGLLINGAKVPGGSTGAFTITIGPLPITEREYDDTESNVNIIAIYFADTTAQYEAGTMLYRSTLRNSVTLINHFRVRLTEITNKTIRGQFSGDFYLDGDPLAQKKTITDGDFYVEIQ